jgi:outer membrane protein OmpA-like peptidoglycan-associated protein
MNLNKIALGIFLSFAAATIGTVANASTPDVVQDNGGKHVHSSNGNCVRTKWMVAHDVCGTHEVKNPTWIFFDFDKSNIRASELHTLNLVADHINSHGFQSVSIYGYADRLGSDSYNEKLSKKRAVAVLNFLKAKTDVEDMKVTLKAFGSHNPVKACEGVKDDLISCLQPNRRVEVLMKK